MVGVERVVDQSDVLLDVGGGQGGLDHHGVGGEHLGASHLVIQILTKTIDKTTC